MTIGKPFRLASQTQVNREGYIHLGSAASEQCYRVLVNDAGQILLDPIDNLPEREQWLWQNSTALSSVQQGIEQVAEGNQRSLGTFAQHADLDIED
ncbi:hypothetical protein C7B65_06760 [Phormidesmis priestleyi ULC007]|uniref:Uncharacterized protein n=1 Tax=Phormidesmis priestleyi ULC007 TaxID=1920490 RepID=A0A2T1DJB1_9CYAN|nr:hypothetical protein [Phormidesmis priestleyi]PSB20599.1 hypothetical protein C7B65_06760 [Phormidesmis priestleyi ULC007]PZO54269.1 MAG: hypothetical protein DCF14_02405 [Phormidesmis priestleyi]